MATIESHRKFQADVLSIAPREIRSFIGVAFEAAQAWLEQTNSTWCQRVVLMKRLDAVAPTDEFIADILATLADTALRMWPVWYSDIDFDELGSSALDRAAGGLRVDQLSKEISQLSAIWAKRAIGRAISHRPPLVRGFARETQLKQLSLVISRHGLILVIALDGCGHAIGALQSLVHSVEWLARQGEMAVAVLLARELADHPALQRIMYNAVIDETPLPAAPWPQPPEGGGNGMATPTTEPADVWLWPVLGRPHPNSPGEKKLALALIADAELGKLFTYNRRVETIYKSYPIVDLLSEGGRVVVKIDGFCHWQPHQYAADRHRDFQLLVSGYLILRLPHDEVMRDTARAVEKIRRVVDYRKSTQEKTEQRP